MEYGLLGRTQIKVSLMGLGCWAFAGGNVWGVQEEKDSVDTVRAALDAGINFFDTAEMYGDGKSEEVLGKALQDCRHQVVIASKAASPNLSQEDIIKACEQSLKRLRTDYLDLYQIHWPNRSVPLEETVAGLEQLVQQGKVRAVGVSNFGVKDLDDILKLTNIATDQLPYSLLWRPIEHSIQPKCVDNNVGILAYSPLSQGLLTGKYRAADEVPQGLTITRFYSHERSNARHGEAGMEAETFAAIARLREICEAIGVTMGNMAIAWLLRQAGVSSVIVGARKPQQLNENIKAADVELADEVLKALTEATERLKAAAGNNPDMWEGRAKSRYL